MSENRRAALESIHSVGGLPVFLVTDANVQTIVKPGYPFHTAYPYLSATHKSDYLRTYILHHYGGVYADIKLQTASFVPAFETMQKDSSIWISGYSLEHIDCVDSTGVSPERAAFLRERWAENIGVGLMIARPYTPITKEWTERQAAKLDRLYPRLVENPAQHPRDGHEDGKSINGEPTKYPVYWGELLGSICHDVFMKYQSHIRQLLPRPIFHTYR